MESQMQLMIQTLMEWYGLESNSILRGKYLMAKTYLEEALDIKNAVEEERKNG